MMRTLLQKLRSPWAFVGVVVVFAAFIAGLAFGLPASDGIVAQERPSVPAPDPDNATIPGGVIESTTVEVIRETTGGSATSTATSKARKEFLKSEWGRALYFARDDRVIHLPADVRLQGVVVSVFCAYDGGVCPETPLYVLEKGEATIALDRNGDIVSDGYETDDLTAFPFLTRSED